MKRECEVCKKGGDTLMYNFIEVVWREVVPTENGGIYTIKHLTFCAEECLKQHLFGLSP